MVKSFVDNRVRGFLALALLLSGMLLLPYIALPSERFGWQLFAGIYGSGPEIAISYDTGAPGSTFVVTGIHFPANTTLKVKVNDIFLGTVVTDDLGSFMLHLVTTSQNELGYYEVEVEVENSEDEHELDQVTNTSAGTRFRLLSGAPLRSAEGSAPSFVVPNNSARDLIHLPLLMK